MRSTIGNSVKGTMERLTDHLDAFRSLTINDYTQMAHVAHLIQQNVIDLKESVKLHAFCDALWFHDQFKPESAIKIHDETIVEFDEEDNYTATDLETSRAQEARKS
jgi:hypothetical protein